MVEKVLPFFEAAGAVRERSTGACGILPGNFRCIGACIVYVRGGGVGVGVCTPVRGYVHCTLALACVFKIVWGTELKDEMGCAQTSLQNNCLITARSSVPYIWCLLDV